MSDEVSVHYPDVPNEHATRNDWRVPHDKLKRAAVIVRCQEFPIAVVTNDAIAQLFIGSMSVATAELVGGKWVCVLDVDDTSDSPRVELGTSLSIPCTRKHSAQKYQHGHDLDSVSVSQAHAWHLQTGKPELINL